MVGDRPVLGLLRGDGIGVDIAPAMQAVVAAAVKKAYGGRRVIAWCPIHAGLEGLRRYHAHPCDQARGSAQYRKDVRGVRFRARHARIALHVSEQANPREHAFRQCPHDRERSQHTKDHRGQSVMPLDVE